MRIVRIFRGLLGGYNQYYPLTAPIATPFVICLFKITYTITAGAAVSAITANCTA